MIVEQTLEILHRDDRMVAFDKPSGLLVHRSDLAPDRITCMSIARAQLGRKVYPVHRLDRGTSGVLLMALDPAAARALSEQFLAGTIRKCYLAVVRGWSPESGEIDWPLAEEKGREAVAARTRFRRIASIELPVPIGRYATARYSLVEFEPLTGRMHQIRRHAAHMRHPVIGDVVHGEGRHNRLFRERFGIDRLLLHARQMELSHLATGETLSIVAPFPDAFQKLGDEFGWESIG